MCPPSLDSPNNGRESPTSAAIARRLFESGDDAALRAEPRRAQAARHAGEQRHCARVVAGERGVKLADARGPRVGCERLREGSAYAAALLFVGDLERDLGRASVTDEACQP